MKITHGGDPVARNIAKDDPRVRGLVQQITTILQKHDTLHPDTPGQVRSYEMIVWGTWTIAPDYSVVGVSFELRGNTEFIDRPEDELSNTGISTAGDEWATTDGEVDTTRSWDSQWPEVAALINDLHMLLDEYCDLTIDPGNWPEWALMSPGKKNFNAIELDSPPDMGAWSSPDGDARESWDSPDEIAGQME
jgi:hypothetical protein